MLKHKRSMVVKMRRFFTAILSLIFLPAVMAETSGSGSYLDRRVQTALYNPDNVYRIYAMKNRVTAIEFEPGETINMDSGALGVGKPGNKENPEWMIGSNKDGNMILIKPSQYAGNPETNVIIKTNRRTYLFELRLAKTVTAMTYLFRFDYPKPIKEGPLFNKVVNNNRNPCDGTINREYLKRGDMAISPYEIWDNGTFTCLRFPTNEQRPVIYEVLPDGTEAMINTHTVNDVVVVHGVSKAFRLRLNKLVLELKTTTNNMGRYNYNGTTTGEIREVRNAK